MGSTALVHEAPGARSARARRQMREVLPAMHTPVEAFHALRPHGPALLESRSLHPEARYSFLALNPAAEVTLYAESATEQWLNAAPRTIDAPPLETLFELFERIRDPVGHDLPFVGGWVGYVAHEAASWILGTPVAPPAPPARPAAPWGYFRLYRDALVFDHATRQVTAVANDLVEHDDAGGRLAAVREALSRALSPVPPAARAHGPAVATLTPRRFEERVHDLQRLVRAGDCFQVNLTSSFAYEWDAPPTPGSLLSLYDAYAAANPGAWAGYLETPHFALLSSSPECLADLRDGRVRLRPIAGTRPRGRTRAEDDRLAAELQRDPKEGAEHAMLVDLARNDAAAVCRPGTVEVPSLGGVERYRHVMHLVSEVEGEARSGLTIGELLRAVFPGGTVTGCPKRRAVRRIAETEGGPRGPYTGTLGYVSLNGNSQWNLLIRTLVATPTHLVAHAGCGIVEGSRAPAEAAELEAKARAQVDAALGRAAPAPPRLACGHVEPGPAWRPPKARPVRAGPRVLLIDFEDSFVHNLADYCARLGADVRFASAHDDPGEAWRATPTHLILSPGPGRPEDFPTVQHHVAEADRHGVPILGVCLGHQALAWLSGARIDRHPETVHGKPSPIQQTDAGRSDPVLGRWSGRRGGRYHSLVARGLPPDLEVLASLEDGTCMAARRRDRDWWGLQFHPESILTDDGLALLEGFLGVAPRDRP